MNRNVFSMFASSLVAAAFLLFAVPLADSATDVEQSERDARSAMDAYFEAFNAADNDALQKYTNYPHVFLGSNGEIRIEEDRLDINFDRMRDEEEWHHSTLDSADACLVLDDKVHFSIVFSRQKVDGTTYRTTPGLWVMAKQDGKWGLSLRSY